jgi:phosphohistidine phosphatase
MDLFIARHAWAGSQGDPRWPNDALRELEPEGIERYVRLVQKLGHRGFAPDLIATSPYVRCRQTADLIAAHTDNHPEVVELSALTPGSDLDELCRWSRRSGAAAICWVGHAPDVGELAAALIGSADVQLRFAKGAVAAIRSHSKLGPGSGELQWLVTAKLLGL